jgi:hypothetical protein
MIDPESYIDGQKDKTYKELLEERERLLKDINNFEKFGKIEGIEDGEDPEADLVYQVELLYLGKLFELISKRYNEEFVWGSEENLILKII